MLSFVLTSCYRSPSSARAPPFTCRHWQGELATIIAVHGMCTETESQDMLAFLPVLGIEHMEMDRGRSWAYMQPLAGKCERYQRTTATSTSSPPPYHLPLLLPEVIAEKCGVAVMVIGLPDDDPLGQVRDDVVVRTGRAKRRCPGPCNADKTHCSIQSSPIYSRCLTLGKPSTTVKRLVRVRDGPSSNCHRHRRRRAGRLVFLSANTCRRILPPNVNAQPNSQAIDHAYEAVPLKTNGAATVDKSKVGLLGHSMGGGGVLYGALIGRRVRQCLAASAM